MPRTDVAAVAATAASKPAPREEGLSQPDNSEYLRRRWRGGGGGVGAGEHTAAFNGLRARQAHRSETRCLPGRDTATRHQVVVSRG